MRLLWCSRSERLRSENIHGILNGNECDVQLVNAMVLHNALIYVYAQLSIDGKSHIKASRNGNDF